MTHLPPTTSIGMTLRRGKTSRPDGGARQNGRGSADAPILVTGAHRSGTTWASAMLNLSPGTLMTEEPMNVMPHRYAFDGLARDYFTYAEELSPSRAREAFMKVIEGRTGKVFPRRSAQRYLPCTRRGRFIIKDPIACLSSDWLARNFDLRVLVLVRHPGAFAASLKRMGWEPDLDCFFRQPRLTGAYLADLEQTFNGRQLTFIQKSALTWKIIYRVLADFGNLHPEWSFRRHEDLATDPVEEFHRLYTELGLKWTNEVDTGIREHSSPDNRAEARKGAVHTLKRNSRAIVDSWKSKLDAEEVVVLKDLAYPEWTTWYGEETWN